ncbi:methionine ABC transporter ATP-binding protein [Caulobacter segnis]|uniref:methionine ABC transporter ATP-binding protein n=1 Tax=Caulobacter segnis TaxID=88688 RepID=UPI0024101706|nr:methionine ABC transporter ATP-binding protein [Caulobacter segnis]MDG2523466.1 methionine ABC transporter ATP-binding protein [Caulobacter segnis]
MIEFEQVRKIYPKAGGAALDGVSLRVAQGEVFGVIGQSGAGKSTLIRLINGLEKPTDGRVVLDGADVGALPPAGLRGLRRRIGMIFQHFNLLSSKTVAQNVAFPLKLAGTPQAEIDRRVAELLARVGLADHAAKYPAQLSGGQKQRVGIARALATNPSVLLCDEATSALDPETTDQILALLADLNRELGLTIVLITHEMEVIRRICHRVAVLERGQVVETGEVADVFLHPKNAVTRRMLADAGLEDDAIPADGSALRLTFRGASTYEPILGRIARETGVDYSILSGRIDRIRDEPYGQLTVALIGGDVAEARRRLEAAGVQVEAAR